MNFKNLLSLSFLFVTCGTLFLSSCGTNSVTSSNSEELNIPSATSESEQESPFPYLNKSAVFVGDSITFGVYASEDSKYWRRLQSNLLLSEAIGMGESGSSVSLMSDYRDHWPPLTARYKNIPAADMIFIFMGTNDYGHETPLGTIEDSEDVSFYGAWNVIIPEIQEMHPDSKIILITPTRRYGFGVSTSSGEPFTFDYLPNGKGHSLPDYVNAIKDIAAKYSLKLIDLYSLLGSKLDASDENIKTLYMPDGLHPNSFGHKLIADTIEDWLIENPLF